MLTCIKIMFMSDAEVYIKISTRNIKNRQCIKIFILENSKYQRKKNQKILLKRTNTLQQAESYLAFCWSSLNAAAHFLLLLSESLNSYFKFRFYIIVLKHSLFSRMCSARLVEILKSTSRCKTDRCQFSNHPVHNPTTTNTKTKITCKIFKGFWKKKKEIVLFKYSIHT